MRTCSILVDFHNIVVLGAEREGSMLSVHIETVTDTETTGYRCCGGVAQVRHRDRFTCCVLHTFAVRVGVP